jgi:Zn-dependent peptidase ImmA (M78 family)
VRSTLKSQKQVLAEEAKQKAIDARMDANLDLKSPICIYALCDRLGVRVRFVDISMEGLYLQDTKPQILISALRPIARRTFTCGHELGHHMFGHGSTIDALIEDSEREQVFRPEEFLADSFAGFLLMPIIGIRKAFASRGWNAELATPEQFFTVACCFGVGYETLITHMAYSLKMITPSRASILLKTKPKAIREKVLGRPTSHPLIIADMQWMMPTIDAEVGNELLLPPGAKSANQTIVLQGEHPQGSLFTAKRPGIVRVHCPGTAWAVFVRVSPYQFAGLSQYRHFEEVEDE